jgi:hypothetical protein
VGDFAVSFSLTINDKTFTIDDVAALRGRLAELKGQFSEIWLSAPGGWPTLGALVNGDAALLMYLRYAGDAGFTTRNPDYVGPDDATVSYVLTNGQEDAYPTSWAITTGAALRALEHFFATTARAPGLSWNED